jgi:DNA-binding beta-propeller fold protein YncE
VISAKTNTVTSTVTVGNSPAELAVNPLTATTYVTNYRGSSVSVISN